MKERSISGVVVKCFRKGADILERLGRLSLDAETTAGSSVALGVFRRQMWDFVGDGRYASIPISGPLKVVSCSGIISMKEGRPFIHAHVAVPDEELSRYGGSRNRGRGPRIPLAKPTHTRMQFPLTCDETKIVSFLYLGIDQLTTYVFISAAMTCDVIATAKTRSKRDSPEEECENNLGSCVKVRA